MLTTLSFLLEQEWSFGNAVLGQNLLLLQNFCRQNSKFDTKSQYLREKDPYGMFSSQ